VSAGAANIALSMSATSESPGGGSPAIDQAERPSRREQARTGALVVLAVVITLFAVFNLDEVKVHWIVGSGRAPLIIVIVISLLVGIVLAHFVERRAARRR
jgi:uncharacterized integral membrane protein